MTCDTCNYQESVAACYEPRNLILFRNKKNQIIAYDEFCFECVGTRESENLIDFQKFCLSDMKQLFKNFGIKYFGETEYERDQEYFILKKKGYIKY